MYIGSDVDLSSNAIGKSANKPLSKRWSTRSKTTTKEPRMHAPVTVKEGYNKIKQLL